MRILITNESRGISGGIETYLKALGLALGNAGYELGWLFGHSMSNSPAIHNESSTRIWDTSPATVRDVKSEIDKWQPDVVFANGIQDPRWELWLAKRFPTAYFAHAYAGACISGSKCHAAGTLEVCQRKLGPSCLLIYASKRCGGRNPLRMIRDYRRERLRQNCFRHFRYILVASKYVGEEFERQGVPTERIKILPLFPTDTKPDSSPPEPREWTNNVILMSRLTNFKGSELVVESVSIASEIVGRQLQLIVAGDGPSRSIVANQSITHKLPTQFVGWVNSNDRNVLFRGADALIVPSVWPEPFGLVGIEAGCVGLPSAAFEVGGIPDWLQPGVSGELAPARPATSRGLGNALGRLLSNHEHHAKLRVNAWLSAKQFSRESHLSKLLHLLEQIRGAPLNVKPL